MRKFAIDLHVHTSRSDGTAEPYYMVKYARKLGLDGIAITDHDTAVSEDDIENIQEKLGISMIIPGVESSSLQGHLIILGVYEAPEKHLHVRDVIKFARKRNGLIVIPHPFDFLRSGVGHIAAHLKADAIEVYNGGTLFEIFNSMAYNLALKLDLPVVAGSDAHDPLELGSAFTIIYSENNDLNSILDAIRHGNTFPVYNKKNIVEKIILKMRRKIKKLT